MLINQSQLNIVRAGSYITYSSLKEIGNRILESFPGIIIRYDLIHEDMPFVDSIDALLRHLRRMPRPMDGDECERGGARRGSNPLLGTVSRSGSVKKI